MLRRNGGDAVREAFRAADKLGFEVFDAAVYDFGVLLTFSLDLNGREKRAVRRFLDEFRKT